MSLLVHRELWMEKAACRGMPTAIWFPTNTDYATSLVAKSICKSCPVRSKCQEYGKTEQFGIWGGSSNRTRGTNAARARRAQEAREAREERAS